MSDMPKDDGTRFVHAGDTVHREESVTYPLAPPIVQTTVYSYPGSETIDRIRDTEASGYIYGRYGLPNSRQLEAALMELEGAEAGLATTSGTSAIASTLLGLTETGDRVVAGHNTYGGTRALLDNELTRFGVTVSYVDLTNLDAVREILALDPLPRLLFADTISNPTLITNDIPKLTELAHDIGIPIVVDNTFATPYHFNPIQHGADLVIHSGTKFIGGHNDVSSGAVLGRPDLVDVVRQVAVRTGAIGAAFESWLSLRGLRTLEVRLQRSSANALEFAQALEQHPSVKHVHYPGLSSDPHFNVAKRMLTNGYGSVVSVDFGDEETMRRVVDRLELIAIAETLGGAMTTVVLPRVNYYRHLSLEELAHIGVSPGLARFSIGIESAQDLISDLQQALR